MSHSFPILGALLLAVVGCSTSAPTSDAPDTSPTHVGTSDDTPLLGTKWVLVELNGAAVMADSAFQLAHLIFQADSTVSGSGGCNRLFGPFHLSADQGLRFGDLMSTQMACPVMDTEMALYGILRLTDRYTLTQDTLGLSVGQATPVVRFVAGR